MIVMKFGGTSVGSADSINKVFKIVTEYSKLKDNQETIVVLSAVGGVTNLLVKLIDTLKEKISKIDDYNFTKKNIENNFYQVLLEEIKIKHINIIKDLGVLLSQNNKNINNKFNKNLINYINSKIEELNEICESIVILDELTLESENLILSFGEFISTELVNSFFVANSIPTINLDITNYLIYDTFAIKNNITIKNEKEIVKFNNKNEIINSLKNYKIIITQGFIARNLQNHITNLGRGGSDYSAALIAAEFNASELQIWTDVSGIKTGDPRIINKTSTITEIDFNSVSLMAYWGAKVLHPKTILPTINKNIPTKILNTFDLGDIYTSITPNNNIKKFTSIIIREDLTIYYCDYFIENLNYLYFKTYENSYIYLIENSSKKLLENIETSNNIEHKTSENISEIYSIIINNIYENKLNRVFEILSQLTNLNKNIHFFKILEFDMKNKLFIIGIDKTIIDKNLLFKLANDLHNIFID